MISISRRYRKAWSGERWLRGVLLAATLVSTLAVFSILGFLVYFCRPLADPARLAALASCHWQPFQGQFGILPMVVGSLSLAAGALVLAFPVGIGICCLAHGVAPRPVARAMLVIIHFMASIPTVIYAFVSVFLLVPLVRQWFERGSGFSLLSAMLTLAVLVLPTIVLLIHVRFQQIDPELRLASAALGFSAAGELLWVILPLSGRGLAAAAVLGFGRAIGDTMISLMVAGNAPQFPGSVLDSIRTLTAQIGMVVATDSQSPEYHSIFACGLILFLATAAVSLTIRRLRLPSQESLFHAKTD